MTALELMERLGGEIVMNRVRVVVDGKVVVVALLNGSEWEPTEEGTALMNLHSNLAAEEAKPTKTRKTKQAQVESAPIQPEQEQQAETPETAEAPSAEVEQPPVAE